MSFRWICGLGLLAAIAMSLPVLALAKEPLAPRATYNGRPVDVAIVVTGYGSTHDRANPPMRLPQPIVDPADWFDATSQLAQAHVAAPDKLGYAKLTLEIDAGGAITACRPSDSIDLPVDVAAVCSDFADQKFLPALGNDGQRIAGGYLVTFAPRRYNPADTSQPHPLFTGERDPAPVPTMAPRVDSMYSFPPLSSWMARFFREPQWQTPPYVGLPDDAASLPLTAIVLFDKGAGLDCRVIEGSGVAAQDQAACGYAKAVLNPAWLDASATNNRGIPLYVGGQGSERMAFAPDPDRSPLTTITDEVALRLISAMTNAGLFPEGREASPLRISLTPDSEGKVTHCRIVTSTGTDAGDIAACRIARETVVMQPMEDIFGRMSEYAGLTWAADPSAP